MTHCPFSCLHIPLTHLDHVPGLCQLLGPIVIVRQVSQLTGHIGLLQSPQPLGEVSQSLLMGLSRSRGCDKSASPASTSSPTPPASACLPRPSLPVSPACCAVHPNLTLLSLRDGNSEKLLFIMSSTLRASTRSRLRIMVYVRRNWD